MDASEALPRVSTQGERSTLADVDVFRGVAAFVVAAMHARMITWVGFRAFWMLHGGLHASPDAFLGYLTFPLVWGSVGVPVFFVLSGYCIHRSQAFARVRDGQYQLSTTNFYVRRFFRIYPVLVGAMLLTLVCDGGSRHFSPNSQWLGNTGIGTFLINLFSLQGIAGGTFGSNGPLWTLSIEVQFYALYPLLVTAMRSLGTLPTLLLLLAVNIMSYFTLERYGLKLFSSYYVSWYLGALVAEGEAAGLLARQLLSPKCRAEWYGLAFTLMCGGCTLFFVGQYFAFQLWAVGFAVFLFAVLKRPLSPRGLPARVFRSMGTFSYSLYVVHVPLVLLINSFLFHSVPQVSLVPFCATLVVIVGCAYAFSLVFEKPALALSQKFKQKKSLNSSQGT